MKNKDKKKKWLVSAAALAAVAAMVGTFAWFTSTDTAKNEFEGGIAGNDVEIVETFTKPDKWEPGQKVNKDVTVQNTGNYDSLIRVNLVETISKLNNADSKLLKASEVANLPKKDANGKGGYYLFELGKIDNTFTKQATLNAPVTVNFPQEGAATLKVLEKEDGQLADGTKVYKYLPYWELNSDPAKKYYAKTGGFTRTNDVAGVITPKAEPQFKYVDLTRGADVVSDWTKLATTGQPYDAQFTYTPTGAAVTVQAAGDKNILIEFDNLTKDPTKGKWVYNNKDGNFYYMGVVLPQTQTPKLIDAVTLTSEADNTYSKFKFDLDVNAKSIQAYSDAIDSKDWLNNTNNTISSFLKTVDGIKETK